MASYEDEICYDCMYYGKDSCENPKWDKKHEACRWFKRR